MGKKDILKKVSKIGVKSDFPHRIKPMLATLGEAPFLKKGWYTRLNGTATE